MPKTNYLRDEHEETINALTHAVGVGLFLAGTLALAIKTYDIGMSSLGACVIYGLCQTLTYVCSSVYHSRPDPIAKKRWRLLDHLSIYLAIAGSWTPIFMLGLNFWFGLLMTIFVWSLCGWGMIYKMRNLGKNEIVSVLLYLIMGWSGIIAFLISDNPQMVNSFSWILAGGILYTVGTFFYYKDYNKYYHTIWHLFTIVASAIHYTAVWLYFT